MVNRHRGEVALHANGKTYTLCLTLGALAELESLYGGADILSIAEQFSTGMLKSADAINLLRASMMGGGHDVADVDFEQLSFEGGMAGLIRTLSDLLRVTFSADMNEGPPSHGAQPRSGGDQDAVPFPGRHF